jgi:kumamolisin
MVDGHVVLENSERPRKHDAERVRDVDPAAPIEVTVTLRGRQSLPQLDTSTPALSRAALESGYGASAEDLERAQATLERYGLKVQESSALTRSMRVSGTAAQMEDAFRPGLGIYRSAEGGEFRGREQELQIPAELDGVVTGVFGLDQRRVARRVSSEPQPAPAAVEGLGPSQLEQRYSFPTGSAQGQNVGIAEFGGTYYPDDLSKFCEQHGLQLPQLTVVNAGQQPPSPSEVQALPEEQRKEVEDDSGEVMMDIEIVAGMSQGAQIFVFFSTFDQKGWIDLLNKVISGEPAHTPVLSVSWGLAEDSPDWSKAALQEVNQRLEAAAHVGITVCAASGDDGSGDQVEDDKAHVNFPATSPFVLSVGGTMLASSSEGAGGGEGEGANEVVWWNTPGTRSGGGGSTGGGVSVIFQRPAWQTVQVASVNHGAIDGRVVPDIAALAGPPMYDLQILGQRGASGGTSAATPLWASLIARLLAAGKPSQGATFLPPLLYANAASGQPVGQLGCTDITEGNNISKPHPDKGYRAGPGYDAVSGWGVPNGEKLLDELP